MTAEVKIKRALVIKLRHLGDVLLTGPVFSSLAAAYPDIEIDALVYHDTREMLSLHPHVNQVHAIDRSWRKLGPIAKFLRNWQLYKSLKKRDYQLIVHLTDQWHGVKLAWFLRPEISVAPLPRRQDPFTLWLWRKSFTKLYPLASRRHTVELHLDALRCIGIQPEYNSTLLRFVAGTSADSVITAKLTQHSVSSGDYILIHPTSRWMFKTWSLEGMAALINELMGRGKTVVLSAGPAKEELEWIIQLKLRLVGPVIDFSGQLSLLELGALISRARALISVDSAPMHLAAALRTPVVALFGPSAEIEWGPWRSPHRVISESEIFSCRPCGQAGCGGSKISDCLIAIKPERVLRELDVLLHELSVKM